MFYLGTLSNCCCQVFDCCINLCYGDLEKEKGQVITENKRSPFIPEKSRPDEREPIAKQVTESLENKNETNSFQDHFKNWKIMGNSIISSKPVISETRDFKLSLTISYDKSSFSLAVKVYAQKGLSSRFEICVLNSPESFKPKVSTYVQILL